MGQKKKWSNHTVHQLKEKHDKWRKPLSDHTRNSAWQPRQEHDLSLHPGFGRARLYLARFSAGEIKPQRQDITQYLAAWSMRTRLSEEESSSWHIDDCITMPSSLSTRSPAAIRHNTKSNPSGTSTDPPFRFSASVQTAVSGRSATSTVLIYAKMQVDA